MCCCVLQRLCLCVQQIFNHKLYSMKLLYISTKKMHKMEFPQFAKEMLQILENHNTEALKLQVAHKLLADTMPVLRSMKVRYGRHELTAPMKVLHTERCTNANMLFGLLNMYLRDPERLVHAQKLEDCIRHHLANINRISLVKVSENLELFFASLEADSVKAEALEVLGLNGYVQKARSAHEQYRELNKKRRAELNKEADRLTLKAKALVSNNTKLALQLIDSAVYFFPEVDYSIIIAELNALIAQYNAKLKARHTRNANKLSNATTNATSNPMDA